MWRLFFTGLRARWLAGGAPASMLQGFTAAQDAALRAQDTASYDAFNGAMFASLYASLSLESAQCHHLLMAIGADDMLGDGRRAVRTLHALLVPAGRGGAALVGMELRALRLGVLSPTEYFVKAQNLASRLEEYGEHISEGMLVNIP